MRQRQRLSEGDTKLFEGFLKLSLEIILQTEREHVIRSALFWIGGKSQEHVLGSVTLLRKFD